MTEPTESTKTVRSQVDHANRMLESVERAARKVDPHEVTLETLWHVSPEANPTFTTQGSRWGHGGVYLTVRPRRQPPIDRFELRVNGPFRLYRVADWEASSGQLWRGYGDDHAWVELVIRLAGTVGLPAIPGVGFGSFYPPVYWIDYGRDLQRAIRLELERAGFDGIQIGGEVVVWNITTINKGLHQVRARKDLPLAHPDRGR